ncbi:GlxA family transcriptional regulator [Falsiruegeria mediterranea]|uniref:HTH-type transcriptional regulator CdhR n=1 Tax=Falsiruegeria mediterranea M17 TaxID=1200281 RepID=A0A2R8C7C4_9RHOB|nr:helix-turn-helix domain-containing protein [Falsiruegeria mediterranea]SPJ28337.1 HTH-type transcriptional regulator CdhR [Falsiruegeria mediterranea M17]
MPIQTLILHPMPCQLSSLAIAQEMLDTANRISGFAGGQPVFDHQTLSPDEALAQACNADLVILPGLGLATPSELQHVMAGKDFVTLTQCLTALARPGVTVAGACSGCFALGAAGLLDGRVVTTTWWLAPFLKSLFPKVRLDPSQIVRRDGDLITAGAAFAQIDLMLALIEQLGGFAMAEDCRRFTMADSRPSQLPYLSVATLVAGDPQLQRAEIYLRRNITRQVDLAELAEAAGLGARTFARRLAQKAAMTPTEFSQTLRVTEAIRLARTGDVPQSEIAHRVGYGDATALRRVMRKRTGQTLEHFKT